MKKLLIILFGLFSAIQIFAKQLNYDQASITPETWEEVDLTYTNTIDGKDYTEHANLLRPISWIKYNHLDKIGSTVHLTKEQLGIDTAVKVIAIKPTTLNYSDSNHRGTKPVIATFITHSKDVWDYTFKDQNGNKETIHAVSDHPFYSADRQAFIPIGQFKIGEHVKTSNGNNLALVSKQKHHTQVELTYNFEVYQAHNYKVGTNEMLVHNPCEYEHEAVGLTPEKVQFLLENTTETIEENPYDPNMVLAKIKGKGNLEKSLHFSMGFENKPQGKWVFKFSFRPPDLKEIWGNEISRSLINHAHLQFPEIVTLAPDTIVRSGVINVKTLTSLGSLGEELNGSQKFLKTFLEETPNGKHTDRVLNDFKLQATAARFDGFDYNQFFSHYHPERGIILEYRTGEGLFLDDRRFPTPNIVVDVLKP